MLAKIQEKYFAGLFKVSNNVENRRITIKNVEFITIEFITKLIIHFFALSRRRKWRLMLL